MMQSSLRQRSFAQSSKVHLSNIQILLIKMALPRQTQALLFDVFGTCVDWRSTVTNGLYDTAKTALNAATSSIPSAVRMRATDMTPDQWGKFAQEWVDSYKAYTKSRANDATLDVKTIDEHHLDSLKELLQDWKLDGLWDPAEVESINKIWHRLNPWPDSEEGMKVLSSRYSTCTLSNGNLSLLRDLKAHTRLAFTHIYSAEEFGTFKPNKAVYLGAAQKLGLQPGECAMVAAHLGDLKAAKECGYSTIYVERRLEEDWDKDQIRQARQNGFVDIWVSEDENGFLAVAEKVGAAS